MFVRASTDSISRPAGSAQPSYNGPMQTYALYAAGALAALGLVGLLTWRWFHRAGREIQVHRMLEAFALQRPRLESLFFEAAVHSGKPRGLRWKHCEFDPHLELVRDRDTSEVLALVPVTIAFEAVEGSDMEGLPAVGNLRAASAVFSFVKGQWTTNGRAVFNLSPPEAIAHFGPRYERISVD